MNLNRKHCMYMYIAAIVIIRANSAVFDWLTVIYTLIFIYSSKWTAIIHKLRVTEYSAVSLLNSFDCGCKNQSQSPVSRLLHFCARISVSQDSSNIFKQITLASEFNNKLLFWQYHVSLLVLTGSWCHVFWCHNCICRFKWFMCT